MAATGFRRKMWGMKHEYHEVPKVGENFAQLARAVPPTPRLIEPSTPKLTPNP
jgi:hypothetical protein